MPKPDSIQRTKILAGDYAFRNFDFEAPGEVERFGYQAFGSVMLARVFRAYANTYPIVESLLYTYNGKRDKSGRFSRSATELGLTGKFSTEELHNYTLEKQGEERYLSVALGWLIDQEGMMDSEVTSDPQSVLATVTLRELPFGFRKYQVSGSKSNDSITLQALTAAAQSICIVQSCSVEEAIKACMTDSFRVTTRLPDEMTMRAVQHVLAHRDISIHEIPKLKTKLDELNWSEVRDELRSLFAADVRKKLGLLPDEDLTKDDYPEFAQTTTSCKKYISRAAMGAARMFIDLPKQTDEIAGRIQWHQRPGMFGLGRMFDSGLLCTEPINLVADWFPPRGQNTPTDQPRTGHA